MNDVYKRPIWRKFEPRTSDYIGRCSKCGRYESQMKHKNELLVHWFFNGVYCRACIQDKLYDDIRTVEEMT